MKSIVDWLRILVAIAMLVGIGIVVWKYKWIILVSILVFVLVIMGINALYRMCTGKDMPMYTRIFKD